ncbi:transposase [Drepanopeziza brunnea f. sp. 'multigermtubi' MB_m1]|uniref:Transposase n=1 Tax=Marssonina brunnea f. sp. multigermtubi (strain MB_m1) TaxID=1072389 RepID=K1WFK6_MARBU|nr:transposase [Drepanopeziza brunnea f. sp. 'multigermtubi' MB_m1]EKD16230.1 transposase [Drepanopeziza brunnea f. sp. 'multigermtubi' MB_m1]
MGRKRTRSKKPSRIFQYKSHAQPSSPNAIEDLATRLQRATTFLSEYPQETQKTAARIYDLTQDTNAVHKWFKSYRRTLKKMNIRPKDIINFDETGFRIGCPRGTEVLVLGSIQEFYSVSPENRRSVTIIEMINATSQKPVPPMILIQSKRLMQQWFVSNLPTSTLIKEADNGFTDNKIALLYLEHYIKNADCGPNKP